jgi:hypothetical protein
MTTRKPTQLYSVPSENCPVDYDRSTTRFIEPAVLRSIYGHPRLDGKPRHIVIRPALPLWEIAIMMLAAVFIGVLLATGGVL